jgi:hypothetical protein
MPVMTNGTQAAAPGGGGATVPFLVASNVYVEKFDTTATALGAASTPITRNVIPNGFLSSVRMEVRCAGGTAGTLTADGPWDLFLSAELDNIDGANIQYPMGGYSHYVANANFHPWLGDPATRWDFAASVNPSFSLSLQPEVKSSLGVLANTDARSQYKVAYTVAPVANVITGVAGTVTATIALYLETWAQPDAKDLHGNPQEMTPPGLNLQTLRRHQVTTLNGAGAANTIQIANTGNELRGLLLVIRDSLNARQDYLSDPMRLRLDTRAMGVFSPNELFNLMNDRNECLSQGTSVRPTGTYFWQRFRYRDVGEAWLPTTNATYLIIESATAAAAANVPGTIEIITDEVIPVGPVPVELDSI